MEFPIWDEGRAHSQEFVGYLNFLLDWVEPHPSEVEMIKRFGHIGIGPGWPFYPGKISPDILSAIEEGIKNGRSKIEEAVANIGENVNGWMITDTFMTDIFGTREYINGNYLLRAAGAIGGLYGNTKMEAFYPMTLVDEDGERLDTSKLRYLMRFEAGQLPPAKAFWSVTIYDTSYDGKAGFFVDNPIDRYLINAGTRGLEYGEDGSLEIYIQRDMPDMTRRATGCRVLICLVIPYCGYAGRSRRPWTAHGGRPR